MKAISIATLLTAIPLSAAPLAVGTIADDVGYSEATEFSGSNYQRLLQRHASDHPDTVLALIFATPW